MNGNVDTRTLCVIGNSPHSAHEGYLCENHLQRFANTLRSIEEEYATLSAVPSMQVRSGRGGSLPSHRSPARLDAIVATDRRRGTGHLGSDDEDPWALDDTASVLDALHSWARVVREERGLEQPTHVTVSGERDTLSRHLTWIASQEWADESYGEFQALLGQLRATNGTSAAKPAARCWIPAADGPCNGPIWINWVDGYAHCGDCRETWTGEQLAELNARIEELSRPRTEDGRVMMTVAQIVARFGGNANSVRLKLSRAGFASLNGYYDPAVFEKVTA